MTESNLSVLVVKHLPNRLSTEDREELLKIFGAKKVRCMPDEGKLKYTAFASFDNYDLAKHALSKLHQLEILNQKLVVEFAKKQHEDEFPKQTDSPPFKPAKENEGVTKVSIKEKLNQESIEFSKKLHSICPTQGLDYLPSPLLKYSYPPPTPSIIANISHALAAVPKFYNQVLHLMNKMNLPAPFGPITPIPPMNADQPLLFQNNSVNEQEYLTDKIMVEEMDTSTEEESELESDNEEKTMKQDVNAPTKRPSTKSNKKRKKFKLHHLLTPSYSVTKSSEPHAQPSDVFELQPTPDQRRINFNIKPNLNTERNVQEDFVEEIQENIGSIQVLKIDKAERVTMDDEEEEDDVNSDNEWKNSQFISLRELKRKRISDHEMKTLSAFKNYTPGEPSVRLYIKNLARQVDEKDLRYVFGRFVDQNSESDRNMFDVRLMKEGRMKGQAFITLANEAQAISAVRECNGYILHTKPLVVQFARSAKPKEDTAKSAKKQKL